MTDTASPDLREQIAEAPGLSLLDAMVYELAEPVRAVVQPEIDQRDAENQRLREELRDSKLRHISSLLGRIDGTRSDRALMGRLYTAWWSARRGRAKARQHVDDVAQRGTAAVVAMDSKLRAVEAERDQLKATVGRVRAVHYLREWTSLSDVCHEHHRFRQVEPTAENIAVADVCPDCRPRRYMACVCAEDPCPVLVALDQPADPKKDR